MFFLAHWQVVAQGNHSLLKPFTAMMSLGRVCYADVTPCYCSFLEISSEFYDAVNADGCVG